MCLSICIKCDSLPSQTLSLVPLVVQHMGPSTDASKRGIVLPSPQAQPCHIDTGTSIRPIRVRSLNTATFTGTTVQLIYDYIYKYIYIDNFVYYLVFF